jgi:diguanylate cyclase (GGDEF)-like protein/PAS domain S-box-containing protein
VGICTVDADCRIIEANAAFRKLVLGGARVPRGAPPWVNAQPSERAAAEAAWERSRDGGGFSVEFRVLRRSGEEAWVQVATQPLADGNGHFATAIDVTDTVARRTLNERLVGVLDASNDAVVVVEPTGALLFANDAARTLIGVDGRDGDPALDLFVRALLDQVPREMSGPTGPSRWEGEVGVRGPDGIERTLAVVLQVVRSRDGTTAHWSAIARDVTEARQVQDELAHQATHDALTGLPNRVLFLRRLSEALERSATTRRPVAVLFVDLDKLKDVNDTIGHAVGDVLLTGIAGRLAAATRPNDLVARIGGDEFVVLCEGVPDEHVAMDVADRIGRALAGRTTIQGIEIATSASIGVALSTPSLLEEEPPGEAALTLLRNADTAMYRAKQRGRGRGEIYSDDMRREARERSQLTAELERALALDDLLIVWQPVVSAQTGRTVGAEALLRWRHPERGVLGPMAFLELADESGAIVPIGNWVLQRACADAAGWIASGIADRSFVIHVNASIRQLADATFVERTAAIIRESGLEFANLAIDVSERAMLGDNPAIVRAVAALRRLGVRIAIDDFGTGLSSLAHLRGFPADYLKLDGTLVREIGREGADDPIVRSIIQLAHSLGMSVVAEWVTTDEQTTRLRILGCDALQGHRIGEPVPAAEFAQPTRSTRL